MHTSPLEGYLSLTLAERCWFRGHLEKGATRDSHERNDHHRQQHRPEPQPLRMLGIGLHVVHLRIGLGRGNDYVAVPQNRLQKEDKFWISKNGVGNAKRRVRIPLRAVAGVGQNGCGHRVAYPTARELDEPSNPVHDLPLVLLTLAGIVSYLASKQCRTY
jgi:hypothetical protein